jgi:hypothetical protein
MKKKAMLALFVMLAGVMASHPFAAYATKLPKAVVVAPQQPQNLGDAKPGQPGHPAPRPPQVAQNGRDCGCVRRSSDIAPPDPVCSDSIFFVDCDAGLDTGCTFRSGGPLTFNIRVNRVVGEVNKLLSNGLIDATATLEMPAFDVDFNGGGGGVNPERDRVKFNGRVVPEVFLRGDDNVEDEHV